MTILHRLFSGKTQQSFLEIVHFQNNRLILRKYLVKSWLFSGFRSSFALIPLVFLLHSSASPGNHTETAVVKTLEMYRKLNFRSVVAQVDNSFPFPKFTNISAKALIVMLTKYERDF